MEKAEMSGWKFFSLGLLVFLALGIDFFVILIDRLIWGNTINISTFFRNPWYVLIIHWSIVVILWLISGLLIFKNLIKKDVANNVILMKWKNNLLIFMIIAVVTSLLLNVFESLIFSLPLPQFLREYRKFAETHGSMGLLVWFFQNMYYIVESMLVVLLLALMQRAGELWFKNHKLPYGGIGLLFTWGIAHLLHGLISGLWICAFSLIFGWLFVKANKCWWPSLLFVWLMFFI